MTTDKTIEELANEVATVKTRKEAAERRCNRLGRDLADVRQALVEANTDLTAEAHRLRQAEAALGRARSRVDVDLDVNPNAEAAADAREGLYTAYEIIEGGSP
jgi:septal ring factor EnvC (AmiA/AmiB activator)